MIFQTRVTIPESEVEALKSCVLNGIANVMWGEGRTEFELTPEQSEKLKEFKERLDGDIDWFMYEKDGVLNRE